MPPVRRFAAALLFLLPFLALAGAQSAEANPPSYVNWVPGGTVSRDPGVTWAASDYGNGMFMAIDSNGGVVTSTDNGATWQTKTPLGMSPNGSDVLLQYGTYMGGPVWVAVVAGANQGVTSFNGGTTWSAPYNTMNTPTMIGYGGGHFLLVGQGDQTMASLEGLAWSSAGLIPGGLDNTRHGKKIAWGNDRFLFPITHTSTYCTLSTSPWVTPILPNYDGNYVCSSGLLNTGSSSDAVYGPTVFGNNTFVTLDVSSEDPTDPSDDPNIGRPHVQASSDNGATWTAATGLGNDVVTGITFGNGVFVADLSSGYTAFSVDGISWTPTGPRPGGESGVIASGNGVFVGMGDGLHGPTTAVGTYGAPTAGPATHIDFVDLAQGPYGASTIAGDAFFRQPRIAFLAAGDAMLPAENSRVVTFTVSSGMSVIGTATATAINGVATFTDLGIGGAAGMTTLTFTSPGFDSITQSIFVGAGSLSALAVEAGDCQIAAPGSAVAIPPSVKPTDAYGNGINGVDVTFTVTAGGGTVPDPNNANTPSSSATLTSHYWLSNVIALGGWTLGSAGANTISAQIVNSAIPAVTIRAFAGTENPCTVAPVVPDAPTGVSTVAGNGSVTVSWLAPANNGGAAIDSYTVTGTPGGTCRTARSTCTISGLRNGTTYQFTVTAHNSVGDSVASTASTDVVPTDPAQRVIVQKALSANKNSAPEAGIQAGQRVTLVVKGLPTNTVVNVRRSGTAMGRATQPYAPIGQATSGKHGRAALPTVKLTKTGPYMFRIVTPDGTVYYLRVVVTSGA